MLISWVLLFLFQVTYDQISHAPNVSII